MILTMAGVAFSYLKYEFGKEGWEVILRKHPNFGEERVVRVTTMYGRHGSIVLLGSAIPGVDTLVTGAAGAIGIRKGPFLIWVFIVKLHDFPCLHYCW